MIYGCDDVIGLGFVIEKRDAVGNRHKRVKPVFYFPGIWPESNIHRRADMAVMLGEVKVDFIRFRQADGKLYKLLRGLRRVGPALIGVPRLCSGEDLL